MAWLFAIGFILGTSQLALAETAPVKPQQCAPFKEGSAEWTSFQVRLELMKKRLAGYPEMLHKFDEYEKARRKGLEELKLKSWERAVAQEKTRAEYQAAQAKRIKEEEKARLEAYEQFVKLRDELSLKKECQRQNYLAQRQKYEQEAETIRSLPEEVELGLKPYRPSNRESTPKTNP